MKVPVAILASSVATVCAVLGTERFWAIPMDVLVQNVFFIGTGISFVVVAIPLTALHFFLRRTKNEPYLCYVVVGGWSLFAFGLFRPVILSHYESINKLGPTLARFVFAGCVAGLVYRLIVGYRATTHQNA